MRRLARRSLGEGWKVSPALVLTIVLATVGSCLLGSVATQSWPSFADEQAYWAGAHRLLLGLPLYDPAQTAVTPFAYQYPPFLAQALMPVVALVSDTAFNVLWIVGLLLALYWLADRRLLVMLAMVAFVPVAVELWQRNVHLLLAALVVVGIRRWPIAFLAGAMIKVSPGLGLVYLAARGRWREAGLIAAAGVGVTILSVLASPSQWFDFFTYLARRGPGDESALLPIPYVARALSALVLAAVAGRLRPRYGDPLLVIAVVVGLPTLWATGLSTLVALVPVIHRPAPDSEMTSATIEAVGIA